MTILIADDDNDDKFLIQIAFKEKGYSSRLVFVEDGFELLSYLENSNEENYPGIILFDINMPGKNGLEVLHEIKQNHMFKRIPVIVFTATYNEQIFAKCYDLGANTCIVKPSTFDDLLHIIDQVYSYWLHTATIV